MTHWKCFGVSEMYNAFGLLGVRLLSEAGVFYEVGANEYHAPCIGDVVIVPDDVNGRPMFELRGYEIPERKLPDAPPEVVAEVWSIPEVV